MPANGRRQGRVHVNWDIVILLSRIHQVHDINSNCGTRRRQRWTLHDSPSRGSVLNLFLLLLRGSLWLLLWLLLLLEKGDIGHNFIWLLSAGPSGNGRRLHWPRRGFLLFCRRPSRQLRWLTRPARLVSTNHGLDQMSNFSIVVGSVFQMIHEAPPEKGKSQFHFWLNARLARILVVQTVQTIVQVVLFGIHVLGPSFKPQAKGIKFRVERLD